MIHDFYIEERTKRERGEQRKKFDMDDESIACSWIHSSIRQDTQSSRQT